MDIKLEKLALKHANELKTCIDNKDVVKTLTGIKFPFKFKARIRYNSEGADAILTHENNKFFCEFKQPQLAVTPGQSIVLYIDDAIAGGGIIEK